MRDSGAQRTSHHLDLRLFKGRIQESGFGIQERLVVALVVLSLNPDS
jgi:hypothetical protein